MLPRVGFLCPVSVQWHQGLAFSARVREPRNAPRLLLPVPLPHLGIHQRSRQGNHGRGTPGTPRFPSAGVRHCALRLRLLGGSRRADPCLGARLGPCSSVTRELLAPRAWRRALCSLRPIVPWSTRGPGSSVAKKSGWESAGGVRDSATCPSRSSSRHRCGLCRLQGHPPSQHSVQPSP